MKYRWLLILITVLVCLTGCVTHFENPTTVETSSTFFYAHDPMQDPLAMNDIKEDPSAIYGYVPREDSVRLGAYAQFDWSDYNLVETAKEERISYHAEVQDLFVELARLREEGYDTEFCAKTISTLRNQARLDAYKSNPEALEAAKASNLAKYGNELGPTPESLFEKYGSWQTVLQKAFSSNHGMDACLGLYDDQYANYVLLGEI